MVFLSITFLVIIFFSYYTFGITGARIVLGILLMSIPLYFILNNLKIDEGERFVFSILLGITIYPSLVYLLGILISFRMATFVTFLILVVAAIALNKLKTK